MVGVNVTRKGADPLAFAERMERSVSAQSWRELTRDMSEDTLQLVDDGFAREKAPDGKRWKRNANPQDKPGRKVLEMTGKLRKSWRRENSFQSFRVYSFEPTADYHQTGRRGPWTIKPRRAKALAFRWRGQDHIRSSVTHPGYPARPMVPSGRQLPRAWRWQYNETATKWFHSRFRKR